MHWSQLDFNIVSHFPSASSAYSMIAFISPLYQSNISFLSFIFIYENIKNYSELGQRVKEVENGSHVYSNYKVTHNKWWISQYLSWCNTHVWLAHISESFCQTYFWSCLKTSYQNCPFTGWPCRINSLWIMPLILKKRFHVGPTLGHCFWSWWTCWLPLRWLLFCFWIIPINPCFISSN